MYITKAGNFKRGEVYRRRRREAGSGGEKENGEASLKNKSEGRYGKNKRRERIQAQRGDQGGQRRGEKERGGGRKHEQKKRKLSDTKMRDKMAKKNRDGNEKKM